MTTPLAAPAQDAMAVVPRRVVARRQDLDDTVTLLLAADDDPALSGPDAPAGPAALSEPGDRVRSEARATVAAPGQFAMLWAFGVGEVPISYSALPGVGGATHVGHTIRAVGATTRALCAAEVGDVVGVRGPFGVGWDLDVAAGRDVVVVAGGIGLAPLRPLVDALVASRSAGHAGGGIRVVIGARSPDQLLDGPRLDSPVIERWRSAGVDVAVTVDGAPPSWTGDVGVVTQVLRRMPLDPDRTVAYVCGPEVMMRVVAGAFGDRGVPPGAVQASLERSMSCAVAHCGRCQLGPAFVCRDGPVLTWREARPLLEIRER